MRGAIVADRWRFRAVEVGQAMARREGAWVAHEVVPGVAYLRTRGRMGRACGGSMGGAWLRPHFGLHTQNF